jgi:hypothetical protein
VGDAEDGSELGARILRKTTARRREMIRGRVVGM